jgi:hypothetical protein
VVDQRQSARCSVAKKLVAQTTQHTHNDLAHFNIQSLACTT